MMQMLKKLRRDTISTLLSALKDYILNRSGSFKKYFVRMLVYSLLTDQMLCYAIIRTRA